MRKLPMWPAFVVLFAACGDDETSKPDTTADSLSDSAADTTAPDTSADAAPDANEDIAADTIAPDTSQDTDTGEDPAVARGRYLVEHVAGCGDCHTPRNPDGSFDQGNWLAGIDCFVDIDPTNDAVGCAATPNLTNHVTGLMNRTDEQIKDMFLAGKRPDGKFLHAFMPYWVFGNMSAGDADAIVAYLRSLPGVDHTVAASQPPFTNVPAAAPVVDLSTIPMPRADYPDQEAAMRGRYLAANVGPCLDCHTRTTEPGSPQPRDWSKAFQGGEAFPRDAFGLPPFLPEVIYSANLTPHASGLEGWTVADIKRVLKEGISKDGTIVCPPMPTGPMGAFGGLTDADAEDIAHFIVSLPPAENVIPNGCGITPMP